MTVFKDFPPMLSYSNGIFWLNEKLNSIEKITNLPDKNCFYINKISKNRVAISYLNGDMIVAEINSDKVVHIRKKILPGVQSFYIQNAWCSHQRGLSSIENSTYRIINYDKEDGIQQ